MANAKPLKNRSAGAVWMGLPRPSQMERCAVPATTRTVRLNPGRHKHPSQVAFGCRDGDGSEGGDDGWKQDCVLVQEQVLQMLAGQPLGVSLEMPVKA